MKSRNLAKIVTLILSCALLIGAVVGISVVANESEGTTVAIKGANIAYEGAVQVVYYVDAQNLAEGDVVKLVITDAEGNEQKTKTNYVDFVKDGVTYKAFFSDGIAPKNLRQNVYAKAIVVNSEGTVVVESAVKAYSPYTYAMNRFGQSATPAQTELYKALLNYGAAVQAVLDPETAGTEANPWADEYWDVTIDGTKYTRGNLFNGTYTANRFIEDGAKSFTGWTDAEDKPVLGWTNMTFKPGVATVLKSNYAETPKGLATFDDGTLGNATTNATAMDNKVTDGDNKSSDAFYEIKDGYFVFEQYNDLKNGDNIKYPLTPAYATTYVYEADFNITEWDMSEDVWLHKFAFWNSNGDEICNVTLTGSGKDAFTFGGKKFALNEWHHIKLVMTVAADGTLSANATIDGAATDGAGFQSVGVSKDYRVANAGMALRNGGAGKTYNSTTLFDNVVAYAEGNAASYNVTLDANGGECAETYNVTMGAAYTLPTPVNGDILFAGWYIGDTRVADSGTWNYIGSHTEKINDKDVAIYGTAPTLVAKWAAPVNVILVPNGGTVSSDTATVYAGKAYTLPTPERAGLIFGGWYDADGNMYAAKGTSWAGETDITLTAKWYTVVSETFNDYDDGTYTNIETSGNTVTATNGAIKVPITANYVGFMFKLPTAMSGLSVGTKYVYETDVTFHGIDKTLVSDTSGMGWVGFLRANGTINETMIINSSMKYGTDTDSDGIIDYMTVYGQKFYKDVPATLRIEYFAGDSVVHVYYDGVYAGTHNGSDGGSNYVTNTDPTKNTDGTNVGGFSWHFRAKKHYGDATFTFDNTLVQVLPEAKESNFTLDANYGTLPEGAQTEWTLATGETYTLPTPILDGFTFAGWSCGDIAIATSGKWAASLGENAVLTANWKTTSAHSTDFSDGKLPSWITGGGLTVENGALQAAYDSKGIQFKPVETVAGASVGTKYIFEMDFTLNDLTPHATNDNNNLAFIGFSHTTDTWQSGTHKWSYLGANNAADAVYMYGNKINKTETVTIRFEFVVTGAKTGDLVVYVNGTAGSNTATTISDLNTGDFYQFNIKWRSVADNRNLSVTIDNVTVAVEYPVVEGTVTLDPNGGILPEDAEDSFTLMNGMKLPELPNPNGGAYAFAGWYNGATLIKGGDTWLGGTATLVAKYLDTTTTTFADATITTSASKNFAAPNSNANAVDAAGVRYIFTTDYTYLGMSAFTGSGTAEDPFVKYDTTQPQYVKIYTRTAGTSKQNYAAVSTASGDIVNAQGEVVAPNGVLNDGLTLTKDEVFLSTLTWGGIAYEIGQTYTVVITITMNNGGAPTVSVQATNKLTNEVKTGSISLKACDNIDYFRWEGRSAKNACGSDSNTFKTTDSFANTTFVVQKNLNGTITVDDTKADASGNKKDPNITLPNYNVNNVDVAGQVFTIQTKYTFKGLGGVFTIDPETFKVTDCYVDNAEIAYMGFYNNNAIGDRLKYNQATLPSTAKIVNADGKVVVDENNILLEEYRDLTADDLFYSQVTWAGITFDIGVEYDLFMSYTTGATTYANGVVTAAVGTTKITATANGVTKTGTMNSGPSNDTDFLHNIQGFSFYFRGDKNMTGSADIAYTFYHSFKDIVTTLYTPDVDLGIADDAKVYGVALHKYNNTTSVKFVSVVEGVAYTLADPAAIDGYTFEGWYVCDTKGNITGEEVIPSTGDAWPFSANVRLAAKWVAVEAGE